MQAEAGEGAQVAGAAPRRSPREIRRRSLPPRPRRIAQETLPENINKYSCTINKYYILSFSKCLFICTKMGEKFSINFRPFNV